MDAATQFSAASTLLASQTIPFGEIATIRSGTRNPTIPENRDYPHVAPDNITPQSGRIINVKSVTEDGVTSGKYKFNNGDVLYSKIRPYLNKVSIAPFDGLCSADMYAMEPKEGYTAQFVAEVLQSASFLTYAAKNSGRASIPKINRRALLSFQIPTPTQEAVSTISRTRLIRDELINTYGKKAEKFDELYNSLATRAFAGEL
nr:restriction endonuclease subunit S [Corynebacterium freneyi]